nr:hypothetical protein [Tanacetum cinerariifolium]
MKNVPPPNKNPNVPEEEPIWDQAPAALVGFTPQWIGGQILDNNNGWLEEEDPEEEPEEEEIEDEDMVNNGEDDAEVINPYEEADPHNRPPLTSDEETKFAPPVAQIADTDDVPIPPGVCHTHGLIEHSRIMPPKRRSQTNPQPTLTQEDIDQLVRDGIEATIRDERERVRIEATRARGPARGPVTAPMAQECSFTGFMKCGPTQFHRTEGDVEEPSIYTAPVPRDNDPYVMVRDTAMDTRGDEDVDTDAP